MDVEATKFARRVQNFVKNTQFLGLIGKDQVVWDLHFS